MKLGGNIAKATLRRAMKALRNGLLPEAKAAADSQICRKLLARRDVLPPVAVYLASSREINIDAFILRLLEKGVAVAAPRWNGKTYDLARLTGLAGNHIRPGPMDIREPLCADTVSPDAVNTWILPGLAFAKNGKRLGYGGGWYDRLLAAASKASVKIGVAYSFQVLDDLPAEPHDMVLTDVVTDS